MEGNLHLSKGLLIRFTPTSVILSEVRYGGRVEGPAVQDAKLCCEPSGTPHEQITIPEIVISTALPKK